MGVLRRAGQFVSRNKGKIALGLAGAGAVGLGAMALKGRFSGRKSRKRSNEALMKKVERATLQTKLIQAKRKLFKARVSGY